MKIMNRKNRGSILILASLFTFLTLLLAFTLFKVLPVEYNAAQKSRVDISGHYALDAGVKDAIAWIESRPQGTYFNQDLLDDEYNNTSLGEETQLVNNWSYKTNIELLGIGHFGITSEAFYRGEKVREVKAQIIREGFSQYALFIDRWRDETDLDAQMVYGLGENLITGPFHTNDFFVLAHQSGTAGFTAGGEPFVSGPYARMTHARITEDRSGEVDFEGDGNAYVRPPNIENFNAYAVDVPYDENGFLEDRYQRVVEGGKGNIYQVESINFPDTATDRDGNDLREKSRGDIPYSGQLEEGVFIATDGANDVKGGVYVVGDSEIELALDANGNQVQKIEQEHSELAYYEIEEVEVERPNYVAEQTYDPPEFVDEVIMVEVPRNVIVDYNTTVTVVDGITTTTQTPVYETVYVEVPQVTSVPYDPDIHGDGPWTIWVEGGDPITYTTTNMTPITEEEYDPDNPNHQQVSQPAGNRLYEVVEVSEDAGYQIDNSFTVEGGGGYSVPKDSTVLLDYEEQVAKVSTGNLNGVTFVDGNIESFKGTVKGAVVDGPDGHTFNGRTVVAAPDASLGVQVTGDILQYFDGGGDLQGPNRTLKKGAQPPNAAHALGLIGHTVEVAADYQTTDTNPLWMYAVILAGRGHYKPDGDPVLDDDGLHKVTGGFGTLASLMQENSRFVGRFKLVGGLLEGNVRPWYRAYGAGTSGLKGFQGNLIYDPAAAGGLQNFPATNNTKVVRYSEYADYN